MLVLRRFSEEGIEMNQVIGNAYTLINRETNQEKFRELFRSYFKTNHVADNDPTSTKESKNCYGFVCEGALIQALYKNQKAFMMTESGQTFDNLTYK